MKHVKKGGQIFLVIVLLVALEKLFGDPLRIVATLYDWLKFIINACSNHLSNSKDFRKIATPPK